MVHRRYLNLCLHTRGHAKAAKLCTGIYGLVWNANQCEENVFVVIDNDKKRREQEPAPLLTINGETLQRLISMTRADIWDIGARETAI